jgi:hypothetical protein
VRQVVHNWQSATCGLHSALTSINYRVLGDNVTPSILWLDLERFVSGTQLLALTLANCASGRAQVTTVRRQVELGSLLLQA